MAVGDAASTLLSADCVVDADGLVLAPGFWDIHTHYDVQLLWDPLATSSSWHGVTTIVTGNCGFSPAPCRPDDQEFMTRTLARLEGVEIEVLAGTLPWPWETFGEYLATLEGRLGVNVIAQVGHMALRRYVMGAEASEREAREPEVEAMRALLAECLAQGGMGFSTSRAGSHWDGDGRPVPSRLASESEYRTLVAELSALDAGFVQLLAPDFGVDTLAEIAKVAGLGLNRNALVQRFGQPDAWRDELAQLAQHRAEGTPFFAQAHCQPHDFEVTFRATDVFDRWPTWRETLALDHEEKCRQLRDPSVRARMRDEMESEKDSIVPLSWERIVLIESPTGRHAADHGRRLSEIAAGRGCDPLDAAIDMALEEDLDTHFRVLDSRNQDEAAMLEILRSPHVVPGPSDAGAHLLRAANTGFPTYLLGHWVREKQALGLEEAVHLLSGRAANMLGVTDRGFLLEGQAADLVLFDPDSVGALDRAFVHDLPGGGARWVQYAGGIASVWVNGEKTLENGEPTGALSGRTLRG
ncbi:MAG: amidohydrolase family protein [Novosphingopyxis baekryungensis]|nr:amidohydrolase family protein [Novosphingopyxis baekryungensis]